MMFARASLPFAFCARCGGWTARRTYRLAKPCGPPTEAGRQALARIARGEHPWRAKNKRSGREEPRGRISYTRTARWDKAADGKCGDDVPYHDCQSRKRRRLPVCPGPEGTGKRPRCEGEHDRGEVTDALYVHPVPTGSTRRSVPRRGSTCPTGMRRPAWT